MKVVHVIGNLMQGGAESVLVRLVTAPSDVEHHVISIGPPGVYSEFLAAEGIFIEHLNARSPLSQIAALGSLHRAIRKSRPDVIQSWMYLSNLLAGVVGRVAQIPVVWGLHCAYLDNLPPTTRLLVTLTGMTAGSIPTRVINCSACSVRAHHSIGFARAAVDLVPNGVDTELFSPDSTRRRQTRLELGFHEDCFVIGSVARWHIHKDHRNLVQSLRSLSDNHGFDWRCVLVGPGMCTNNAELRALLTENGYAERYVCLGPRDDIPDIMRGIDLHVLPSIEEAFPNALIESMSSGTPCVATDVGDTRLIIGNTGWSVPAQDFGALAGAIREAHQEWSEHDGSWVGRQQAARERVVSKFSLRTMVKVYTEVWARAVAERGADEDMKTINRRPWQPG